MPDRYHDDAATQKPAVFIQAPNSEPEPTWKADDRRWFAENPRRSYRLRRLRPAETLGGWSLDKTADENPCKESYVIVKQMMPGFRLRAVVGSNKEIPDDDTALGAFFDRILEDYKEDR
jgi:hypothetical protein